MKPGTVTNNGAGLPAYTAPPGIPEEARKLYGELGQLLAPIDEREAEISRLTATRDEITRRRGKKRLNPEDRTAILEAAADRMQVEALSERIEALEGQDNEKPVAIFLTNLPYFYRKALGEYYKQLVTHFAEAVAPGFNNIGEARQAVEPILPAIGNLDYFMRGESLVRFARDNPLGLARTALAHLEKLSAGNSPWQWPPGK